MQVQQDLHCNEEVAEKALHSNAVVAGATILCHSSRRYTVMQKYQALHCNAEVAGIKLQCRNSRCYIVMKT
jgi:hypothetical protein